MRPVPAARAAPRRATRAAAARRACASASCASDPAAARPRRARARLDRLRDDDGRRVRPAAARGRRPQQQLGARSTTAATARPPDRQPAPDPPRAAGHRAGHEARDHRDRGPALLHQRRRRPARHRARVRPGHRCTSGPVQGASTITQQFVKNALAAQNNRTVFEKLREAALAYHLTRKWSKEKILREYLNTIYFGNGAYGIESAARTYFGSNHPGCGDRGGTPCASLLLPQEAALLAGDGRLAERATTRSQHPVAATQRRDLVLRRCSSRASSPRAAVRRRDAASRCPPTRTSTPPQEDTKYPYFTSWVKQQVVDQLGGGQAGARLAFDGGLKVKTTLDPRLQDAAQRAIDAWLPYRGGPRASLVAIDNKTGEVRAMVGGDDYSTSPFNLATQGQRQPGSSFKPFVLAAALQHGISPDSVWASHKKRVHVPQGGEKLHRQQLRRTPTPASRTLADATDLLRQLRVRRGRHQGRDRSGSRSWRARMGIRTPRLAQPGDRARRPQAGRDAARHGARLRDDRQRRPADHGTLSPGRAHERRSRAGRHRATVAAAATSKSVELPTADGGNKVRRAASCRRASPRPRTRDAAGRGRDGTGTSARRSPAW